MKYEVTLRREEQINGEYKQVKIIVENLKNPKIIDNRLVFFEDGLESTVFNKDEWALWKKLRKEDVVEKNWDWEEIQKKTENGSEEI